MSDVSSYLKRQRRREEKALKHIQDAYHEVADMWGDASAQRDGSAKDLRKVKKDLEKLYDRIFNIKTTVG